MSPPTSGSASGVSCEILDRFSASTLQRVFVNCYDLRMRAFDLSVATDVFTVKKNISSNLRISLELYCLSLLASTQQMHSKRVHKTQRSKSEGACPWGGGFIYRRDLTRLSWFRKRHLFFYRSDLKNVFTFCSTWTLREFHKGVPFWKSSTLDVGPEPL